MATAALIISVLALALSLATITMHGRTIRRGRPTGQIPTIWDAGTGHHKPDLPYPGAHPHHAQLQAIFEDELRSNDARSNQSSEVNDQSNRRSSGDRG